ncbi:hypothetical protein OPT61_g9277 [Boeremia exigua]|uniref:Uncharacterized protein n=1 Tax=Boeremia exigua TaxID=749465 RepID=A0ACC2HUT1_9PLEO|nr:hypothetical protein OPT61_g9277 [Boeremia exigua]
MSHPDTQSPHAEASSQAVYAFPCATELAEPADTCRTGTTSLNASPPAETLTSPPPAKRTRLSTANKLCTKRTQRERFTEHLRAWAANHDSSVYFNGSISLLSHGSLPDEDIELGKSVTCNLTDASAGHLSKTIVVRLFQSQRYESDIYQGRGRRGIGQGQFSAPYHMVVRSGSGWVPARQYFDKRYFAHYTRSRKEKGPALPPIASITPQMVVSSRLAAINTNWITPIADLIANAQVPPLTSLTAENAVSFYSNRIANANIQPGQSVRPQYPSSHVESLLFTKGIVKISPLFRPFLKLPRELQDEILYHAVGYTRIIDLTHTPHTEEYSAATRLPITMSKLFRISKSFNQNLVPHVFRCTDFHFGITGFTKFLWQLGPINRSNLRHLTFHFRKDSLLHCIRWMAPDPVWELFEPPVATTPPTLIYFWRCQLQDLMKDLNLSTITIDLKDVPLADVPMLVKILGTVVGSVQRIQVINDHARTNVPSEDRVQDLHTRLPDMLRTTWRGCSLQYHNDYKHQRWHMKHVLAVRDVDLSSVLDVWMDKDKSFFDS